MPAGSAPGERRGGRGKGTPNKKRTEREIIARKLKVTAKTMEDEARAELAAMAMQAVRKGSVKLAKDVLEDFMTLFAGMAAHFQPAPPNQPENPRSNEVKFKEYAALAVDAAAKLAKYQSPTLRAIMVATDDGMGKRQAPVDNVVSIPAGDPVRAARVYRMIIDGDPAPARNTG